MTAATAAKRVRQHANKLSQLETASPPTIPPAQTMEITSPPTQPVNSAPDFSVSTETTTLAPWPTPAPSTFTISYTPLSILYPEPTNPTAKLSTDTIRVTRDQLTAILHELYIHGSEHGWKANIALAKACLQAEYEKDMETAATNFAEHKKQIRQQEFNCGFEDGQVQFQGQFTSTKAHLETKYKERHIEVLVGFAEHSKEISDAEFTCGFSDSHATARREELECQESARAPHVDCSMQTEPPEHEPPLSLAEIIPVTVISSSCDPEPPIIPSSFLSLPVSDFLSALFEPFEPNSIHNL